MVTSESRLLGLSSGIFSRLPTTLIVLTILLHTPSQASTPPPSPVKKVGILLINHGSRSSAWRGALELLERNARNQILSDKRVAGVKTAFMEYTEPSIATSLKKFDAEGYTDVILIPVFLTVSGHTFDDIPTIIGSKTDPHSLQTLKIEKIERYTPKARTHLTPMPDFPDLLKKNILSRVRKLSKDPANEGLVLIAYGDKTYEKEWSELMNKTGDYIKEITGIGPHSHGWAGHIAHYDPAHTTRAIEKVLASRKRAIVVPVFVAMDEMFQVKIIGDGISAIKDHAQRVAYSPDAILPDKNVESWIIETASKYVSQVMDGQNAPKDGQKP